MPRCVYNATFSNVPGTSSRCATCLQTSSSFCFSTLQPWSACPSSFSPTRRRQTTAHLHRIFTIDIATKSKILTRCWISTALKESILLSLSWWRTRDQDQNWKLQTERGRKIAHQGTTRGEETGWKSGTREWDYIRLEVWGLSRQLLSAACGEADSRILIKSAGVLLISWKQGCLRCQMIAFATELNNQQLDNYFK